ncbi:hypothetical protein [Accumulibacter sp.]|uniref:hypothetical protein n=1 Tax=Accumulibacter sp. TaxID=2053492 RepID=UPI0025E5CF23|nr:hypothetical protein [Accumulibacter sp.]MCM8627088.1 hypothetical protein [Accumulibacter sp.]
MSDNKNDGKGFAGLDSMVSDVTDDVRNVISKLPQPRQEPPRAPPPSPLPVQSEPVQPQPAPPLSRPAPIASGKQPSGGKNWLVWGGIILFLIWVFGNSGKSNNNTSYSPPPSSSSSSSYAPAPAPVPAPAPAVVSSAGEKPPVGNGLSFNREQIRYCLTEKYRVSAIESIVDNTRSGEVAAYNAMVDDYNSRCSHFRYRRGMLESVRSEVDARANEIRKAAQSAWIRQVLGIRSSATPAAGASKQRASVETAPPPVAQTVAAAPSLPASQPSSVSSAQNLTTAERESLEAACSQDKYLNGPAAYNQCLVNQLAAVNGQSGRPNLSGLNTAEHESIEAACSQDKYLNGPAAYNSCLNRQLAALSKSGSRPSLAGLSSNDRNAVEMACSQDKYLNGPAAYNSCMSRELASMRSR